METFVTVIHVLVAVFMILVVLIQGGNQGGVGAAFGGGGGAGSVMGATGGQSLLGKITYAAAAVFMVTSLTLTIMQSDGGSTGLKDQLKDKMDGQAPAAATLNETDTSTESNSSDPAKSSEGSDK